MCRVNEKGINSKREQGAIEMRRKVDRQESREVGWGAGVEARELTGETRKKVEWEERG